MIFIVLALVILLAIIGMNIYLAVNYVTLKEHIRVIEERAAQMRPTFLYLLQPRPKNK
jgi:hypothetical protein